MDRSQNDMGLVWALILFVGLASILLANPAWAQMSASQFLELNDKPSDEPRTQALISGIGRGVSVYNTILATSGAMPLYCPNRIIEAPEYVSLLRKYVREDPALRGSFLVELALLQALEQSFPCRQRK